MNAIVEKLTVGEYTLSTFGAEDYWIEYGDGEGMAVQKAAFEALIADYYKAHF